MGFEEIQKNSPICSNILFSETRSSPRKSEAESLSNSTNSKPRTKTDDKSNSGNSDIRTSSVEIDKEPSRSTNSTPIAKNNEEPKLGIPLCKSLSFQNLQKRINRGFDFDATVS